MSLQFFIKQNDTSPTIRATLRGSDGNTLNLSNSTVSFIMKRNSGDTTIQGSAIFFDAAEGIVEYEWQTGDTAVAGTYKAAFKLTYSDGRIETFPNTGSIEVTIQPQVA